MEVAEYSSRRFWVRFEARQIGLALLLFALISCATAISRGQDSADKPEANTPKEKPSPEKIKLSDATRINTEDIARRAAKEKAKDDKKPPAASKEDAKKDPAASGISELQPSEKAKDDKGDADTKVAPGGGRRSRKVHGSVSGVTGSGGRATDAEIGAGSKSGKTHVYVETGQTVTPQPHP